MRRRFVALDRVFAILAPDNPVVGMVAVPMIDIVLIIAACALIAVGLVIRRRR